VGYVAVLEILVLGPLALWIVLRLLPAVFEIESQCFGPAGAQRIGGDTYNAGMVVAGTLGWLLVLIGVVYAQIVESRLVAVLLPIAWFVVLVGGSLIAAVWVGPQLCPS
jgi:hypothetical protein